MPRTARRTLRVLAVLIALLGSVLVATSAQAAAAVTALPTKVSFGSVHLGKSATQSVTLKVAAGQTITHLQSYGGDPFVVPTVPAACYVPGPSQCTVKATFSPTQTGVANGSIWAVTCSSSSSCSDNFVPLTGTGATPGTAPAVSFGQVKFGSTATKPFTVKFDAGWFVRYVTFNGQGAYSGPFYVDDNQPGTYSDPCGASPTATSCTLTGRVAPDTIGLHSDTMNVILCRATGPYFCTTLSNAVSVTGIAPATASPTSLTYTNVLVGGGLGKPVTVTLDPGWRVGSAYDTYVPGSTSSDPLPFNVSDPRYCAVGAAKCVFDQGFAPVKAGSFSADLVINVCKGTLCVDLKRIRVTGTAVKQASRTTVKANAAAFALGQQVTVTAIVSPEPNPAFGGRGTVTFSDGSAVRCAAVPVPQGGGGSSTVSCTFTASGATGLHTLKAVYSGNDQYQPSSATVSVRYTAS